MPITPPIHPPPSAWKDWAGYHAGRAYDTSHDREYFAIRHAAGLIDVTPLFKYEVRGRDAGAFLARVMVRDVRRLEVGQVTYLCWCDDEGKVIDDGTVSRLDEDHYRVTAVEPNWAWFQRYARGYEFELEDSTARIAALSVQGPNSRAILAEVAGPEIADLPFFRTSRATIDGSSLWISRTGYTGDLGYEIWADAGDALTVWDRVMAAGRPWGIEPAGLDAMDVTRVEAGFIMNGVDYWSAHHCPIEARKSTPYELGLGWTVQLGRGDFVGQATLVEEWARGPRRKLVGLELDWDEYEALFAAHDLPPEVTSGAWRSAVPVYARRGRQVGKATSGAWSPILKRNLALADVESSCGALGSRLKFEVTVEYVRKTVTATVVGRPFFDPERKRA